MTCDGGAPQGTRVAEAKALIAASNFKGITLADGFTEGAQKVVAAAQHSLPADVNDDDE